MIIYLVMKLIYGLLSVLLVFDFPGFPQPIIDALSTFTEYVGTGVLVLKAFIGNEACRLLGTFLTTAIFLDTFATSWSIIWWILKKIPFLNISD